MGYKYIILTAFLLLASSLTYPGDQGRVVGDVILYSSPAENLYVSLNDSSLNFEAFSLALKGHEILSEKGLVLKPELITVIDYSKPSNEKRFFVIDLHSESIIYKSLVAHGRNSGELYATRFSNRVQSYQTALGFYITGNTYTGSQGYSLLMSGVDSGYNDNARKRSIVIHGADYVTQRFAERNGRLGRSFGCPALPPELNKPVINLIKEGSVIFGYYPEDDYLKGSVILASVSHI